MRVGSHENEQTGKFEVFIVKDGADGAADEVRLDSEHDTSPKARDRARELRSPEALADAFEHGRDINPGTQTKQSEMTRSSGITKTSDVR